MTRYSASNLLRDSVPITSDKKWPGLNGDWTWIGQDPILNKSLWKIRKLTECKHLFITDNKQECVFFKAWEHMFPLKAFHTAFAILSKLSTFVEHSGTKRTLTYDSRLAKAQTNPHKNQGWKSNRSSSRVQRDAQTNKHYQMYVCSRIYRVHG